MEIYFVRHGRTQFNLEHRLQGGRKDSPLLPDGIAGAKAAGRYLKTTHFANVYSSPQLRALDTAKYIVAENDFDPQITVEPALREFDFGSWDGQRETEVQPQAYTDVLFRHPADYRPELAGNGETYAAFVERTTAAVHRLITANETTDQPLLLVSHGLVTTMTVKTLMGVPVKDLRAPFVVDGETLNTIGHGIVDNDSLTILETTDNHHFTIKAWNETSYLA